MLKPKPMTTQLSVFSFSILVFFPFQESLNLIVCQRYGFFNVLAAIIRESSDKQFVLRIVKALPFTHQTDRVAPKASYVSVADSLCQHVWKNTIFFYVRHYDFSQSRKSLYNTAVYVIDRYIYIYIYTPLFQKRCNLNIYMKYVYNVYVFLRLVGMKV